MKFIMSLCCLFFLTADFAHAQEKEKKEKKPKTKADDVIGIWIQETPSRWQWEFKADGKLTQTELLQAEARTPAVTEATYEAKKKHITVTYPSSAPQGRAPEKFKLKDGVLVGKTFSLTRKTSP